ncbi:hypothetical protein TEHN7126_2197 [Tetragenococcus halophilus subsp. halophilus]|uniref:hypothetical protein n=1 Tax=Tetragenococcus halophilus TaxID=51669 RepID=UPI000CBEAE9B|nr:hypothetical protein [Tetragenococcus halophilus]GBD74258.1 hypothetical protein TEHN7125_2418 [Tetragenococcus halophilus subsp. halophilus]GBD76498.1 hypothetical protein TEHN7126_2197 [Tetragenococcus halophilus subsp. halophilus]
MFNMEEFIEENLTEGYLNRAFFKNQVKIFALNYLNRGQIEQECFDRITKFIEDNEPYPEETEENLEPPEE